MSIVEDICEAQFDIERKELKAEILKYKPSPAVRADLKKFIEVVERLCKFEADHYRMRGWGVFTKEERSQFPLPEVVSAINWLKELEVKDGETKAVHTGN